MSFKQKTTESIEVELSQKGLLDKSIWQENSIKTPMYDRENMRNQTKENPVWVHFGAGNIFRAYIARLQDELLTIGDQNSGIVAVEAFDGEIIDKIYKPHDNLTLLMTLKSDGTSEPKIIGSAADSVKISKNEPIDEKLISIFENPSLQLVSFTITEKGYSIFDGKGEILPWIKSDMDNEPGMARSTIGCVCYLMFKRFLKGKMPVALVSMDNCSHNGEKLKNSVIEIAKRWAEKGFAGNDFLDYLNNENKVTFPWSMIDKITPRPSEDIAKQLNKLGIKDIETITTSKGTFIAPFVNAEESEYLVIEDAFSNGRPPLEKAGVFFADRETVNKTERMKVTTCLNPLHTALAVFGCLLGYTTIWEEMKDDDLRKLITVLGYDEGLPVVESPGIIDPKEFIDEVLNVRLPNPNIPDSPQRIATDTSQKVSIRFGETIKAYIWDESKSVNDLNAIPLVFAAWLRYLLGVDDNLVKMEISSDPMKEEFQNSLTGIQAGNADSYSGQLKNLLIRKDIFGLDLYKAGLGDKTEEMFLFMISKKNAVRESIKRYIK